MSSVERFVILCPYLGESTIIKGSTVDFCAEVCYCVLVLIVHLRTYTVELR